MGLRLLDFKFIIVAAFLGISFLCGSTEFSGTASEAWVEFQHFYRAFETGESNKMFCEAAGLVFISNRYGGSVLSRT
jgi:hypothetical protein